MNREEFLNYVLKIGFKYYDGTSVLEYENYKIGLQVTYYIFSNENGKFIDIFSYDDLKPLAKIKRKYILKELLNGNR